MKSVSGRRLAKVVEREGWVLLRVPADVEECDL
jgi:hypothetical protein